MLKGIPKILSPELLMVLSEMGHSDRLVISDGNFPAESMGKDAIVIRCDGHGVPELLDAILQVFPLDTYVEHPVNLMEVMPGDDVEIKLQRGDDIRLTVAFLSPGSPRAGSLNFFIRTARVERRKNHFLHHLSYDTVRQDNSRIAVFKCEVKSQSYKVRHFLNR